MKDHKTANWGTGGGINDRDQENWRVGGNRVETAGWGCQ